MSEQYQQLINLVVAEGKVDLETATIRINSVSIEEVELGLSWFSHRAEFNRDVFPPFFLADLVKRVLNQSTIHLRLPHLRPKTVKRVFVPSLVQRHHK